MSVNSFEILPDDILYEIFSYLSPVDILQSFLLTKRLSRVCSRMPLLKICRLPFNHDDGNVNKIENYSLKYQITLPNLLSRNHLRTLTIGIHTSRFIERLLLSIPFIENLSFAIKDKDINENDDAHDKITLPATSDAHLQYLSRLRIHCLNNISFHRTIALLSSVLSQICHLSLKLEACTLNSGSLIISGDIIQELCIDRLKPMATYSLSLLLYVEDDLEEKIIFNSFFKVRFIDRESPRVFIQEYNDSDISDTYHSFMIYTFPYNDTILSSYIFSTNLEKFCQNPTDVTDLFPRANTLSFYGYNKTNCVRDLANCRNSISSLVPWLLLTNIKINHSDVITQHTLVSILGMGYNVHTLDIVDDRGILVRTILHNKDKFGTQINQQIKSLNIFDISWTLQNAQRFCTLLSNQFHNLRSFSFTIFDSYRHWQWKPSRIIDGKNKSTKRILNIIYFIVDHLKQLVCLKINFFNLIISNTCCFPHLIRRQLHQYPLSRPCRLRCSTNFIQIWL
ncbi:unnamed protein product [Rotaria sordida]|uniref:F-box domain-containing protein n=1 Tax=Rotaria sordida TaxID=392033 RepID=A0A815JSS2_9BILA|nr:unnamed protein product [Rotaria sordida]